MEYREEFEKIRPYRDEEVPKAVNRLIASPLFDQVTSRVFPELHLQELKEDLATISTVEEFQAKMMYPTAKRILDSSADEITSTGFERLKQEKSYLFISNHRDIVLDSAILNVLLFEKELETTEVAIGNNLLVNDWISDLVKLNKNFIVNRNVPAREMYKYSQILSAYIRETLTTRKTSVWIAQREGRTKDGNDQTQQGLLKMLGLSGDSGFYENYSPLQIAPMAISYEYDPCDILKAIEITERLQGREVKKTPDDDLKSMIAGITGVKGRVHISIGKILDEKLHEIGQIQNKNDQMQALASLIDERIHKNYKLWPTNYIAYDLLYDKRFSNHYTGREQEKFLNYLEQQAKKIGADFNIVKKPLLEMYAKPVLNFLATF